MPIALALDYRPALLSAAGIGRAVRELANALAARNDLAVHLFAHSLAPAAVAAPVPPRAHLHRLPIPGRSLPLLARLGLPAERLAGGARVFHWTDYVMPPVGRAGTVLTVHDLAFVRDATWHGANAAVLTERTRAAIAAADVVIAPSRASAADVRTFAPAADVRVVPFGADHVPAARAVRRPIEGDYALAIGTLEPRKNHLGLLAAWRRLREPRPRLVLVGRRGWECGDLEAAIRGAAAEGWLTWLPAADDATAWALLQHAQLLVAASHWEGFGFPPLEAMQAGVPVVANACAPFAELTGGAALLVDAADPAALAGAIERVLRDPALAAALAAEGRARAAAFRWADCAAAHAAIYREVAT